MAHSPQPSSLLHKILASETAGGLILIATAALALVIANSPLSEDYFHALHAYVGPLSVHHWINDALMALFFLLIGLEVKRELVEGELSTWGSRNLPGAAAIGGMAVPALAFLAFNGSDPALAHGWAVPAATDIAFALGVLSLVGSRAPASLKIFLAALAIIDDLGAVVIIALFYTAGLSLIDLAAAAGCVALMLLLGRLRVMSLFAYLAIGVALWVFMYRSGVHATLAGVILAFCIPITPARDGGDSPLHTLEHLLHKPVAFIILPIFAFANAGVALVGVSADVMLEPLVLGTATALLLGKLVGVMAGSAAVILPKLAPMPSGARWSHMFGVSLLCGIGFTMSLFIGLLAYDDAALQDRVKIGVLAGSILAGMLGYIVLKSLRRTSV
ncbi:MAG: Na+/H+ antiporter NhaA [Alphaproteobacteria bacterium]|nr:MAG: Na+/H+ antiporter NhaA [Alphaproteobacteria bacterium]